MKNTVVHIVVEASSQKGSFSKLLGAVIIDSPVLKRDRNFFTNVHEPAKRFYIFKEKTAVRIKGRILSL